MNIPLRSWCHLKSKLYETVIYLAALTFSIVSCNDQDNTVDIPTSNIDSIGATGANPGTSIIDTTSMGDSAKHKGDTTGAASSTTGADSLK